MAGVVSSPDSGESPEALPGLGRWLSAHAQLVIIAFLVALASLATAALVTTGARQLNSAPRQTTTPYLAAQPNGPVYAPEVSATAGSGAAATSESPAAKAAPPDSTPGRPRSKAGPTAPDRQRAPEHAAGQPPRTPEMSTPPQEQPPSATPPRLPRECRVGAVRALGRCVVRIPQAPTQLPTPPKPPAFPSPPRR